MMLKRIHRVVLIVIALAVGRVLISMNKQEAVRINPLGSMNAPLPTPWLQPCTLQPRIRTTACVASSKVAVWSGADIPIRLQTRLKITAIARLASATGEARKDTLMVSQLSAAELRPCPSE